MLSYKITVASDLVLRVVHNKCVLGPNMGLMCVRGGWVGVVRWGIS